MPVVMEVFMWNEKREKKRYYGRKDELRSSKNFEYNLVVPVKSVPASSTGFVTIVMDCEGYGKRSSYWAGISI